MELKSILSQSDERSYLASLSELDNYHEGRKTLLEVAQPIFQSGKRLGDMSDEERSYFLGANTERISSHGFEINLFGAPGGNGEVKSIIAKKYPFFDDFFAAIPRNGKVSSEEFFRLVQLFEKAKENAELSKNPFVLFTRILTVSRPDTFVSAAAGALKSLSKGMGIRQVKGMKSYWDEFLPKLHESSIFKSHVGDPSKPYLALLDGIIDLDLTNEINESKGTVYKAKKVKKMSVTKNDSSLNQILYGPPGTGKTFHTTQAAVKAAEPEFQWETREELKAEYDRLVAEKRIRFVTFHQSYGYEEFVEGIGANTNDELGISYAIKPGEFKLLCDAARLSLQADDADISSEGRVWKISIEGTYQNARKTYCLNNNLAVIGWDDTGDLSKEGPNDYFNSLGKNDQNSLNYFSQEMKKGDLVLCINSNTSVEAVGVVDGDYQYVEGGIEGKGYAHHLPVKWLASGFSVDFRSINDNKRFNLPTCYPLSRLSVIDVLSHLSANEVEVRSQDRLTKGHDRYVLIIDEINRGNISKIFGELITLIEPSKRMSANKKPEDESLEISLPHSKPLFSVPENLYLIGTMNTADRSLAMMDTALRRRFDFVEMMPRADLFSDHSIEWQDQQINLQSLLEALNKRIEVLYDREHTLGHAFLFPAYNAAKTGEHELAFDELKAAFKNKIIPLLEEYFYEDWNKIRLVLGDSLKEGDNESLQLIEVNNVPYTELFGADHGLELYEDSKTTYQMKPFESVDSIWDKAEAYIGIYSLNSVKD
ncbi:AAA family ATPase [Vibrio splendidus]